MDKEDSVKDEIDTITILTENQNEILEIIKHCNSKEGGL